MALGQIEKQYGKGAIMRLGEHGNVGVAAIPTGAMALDIALGIGGLPRGRVVEVFGPESSGKTTLAMHVIAEAQNARWRVRLHRRRTRDATRSMRQPSASTSTSC